eukprot:3908182-Rhodomonas_salina.7
MHASGAICLYACYAMPGIAILPSGANCVRACYAMPGTDAMASQGADPTMIVGHLKHLFGSLSSVTFAGDDTQVKASGTPQCLAWY